MQIITKGISLIFVVLVPSLQFVVTIISPATFHPPPFINVDTVVIRDNLVIHSLVIQPVCEWFLAAIQKISAMG